MVRTVVLRRRESATTFCIDGTSLLLSQRYALFLLQRHHLTIYAPRYSFPLLLAVFFWTIKLIICARSSRLVVIRFLPTLLFLRFSVLPCDTLLPACEGDDTSFSGFSTLFQFFYGVCIHLYVETVLTVRFTGYRRCQNCCCLVLSSFFPSYSVVPVFAKCAFKHSTLIVYVFRCRWLCSR